MHNGYVRQGWILLINPTGYIVPPARDGHTASSIPCFVPEDAPPRRSSAARSVPRPSILRFYEKAVSFYRDELCRRPVRVVIISLSLCALAPKAVPVCGYRSLRTSRFLRLDENGDAAEKRDGARTRSGELP